MVGQVFTLLLSFAKQMILRVLACIPTVDLLVGPVIQRQVPTLMGTRILRRTMSVSAATIIQAKKYAIRLCQDKHMHLVNKPILICK